MFYSCFAGCGLDIAVEDGAGHARLDMAVRFNGNVYLFLFELEVVEMTGEGAARVRLKGWDHAEKSRARGGPIRLAGVELGPDTRNIVAVEVADG